jgi:DNA-binding transcriptional regulator PaaX
MEGLETQGLIERRGDIVHLTNKGKELLEVLSSRRRTEKKWKSRWWMVMYDIPVSLNAYRFELRRVLEEAGFRILQHSVWISPYPCRELELSLRDNPEVSQFIRYIEVPPFAHMETLNDWKKLSAP